MKTVLSSTKRLLAMFLALALVVLAIPDTTLLAADRYRAVTNEETGDTEYVVDNDNGDLIYNEATGSYEPYTAEPDDTQTEPAQTGDDTQTGDTGGGGLPQNDLSQTMNASGFNGSTLFGDKKAVSVSWEKDSGVADVKVYQIPDNEATQEIATSGATGNYTFANALYVAVKFATGYEADAVTYAVGSGTAQNINLDVIDSEDDTLKALEAEGYVGAQAVASLEAGSAAAVAISVTSAPVKFTAALAVANTATAKAVDNGVDTADNSVVALYYDNDVSFQLESATDATYDTITKVQYYVGTSEAFNALTDDALATLPEASSSTKDGVTTYTIGKAVVNTLLTAEDGAVLNVIAIIKESIAVTLAPIATDENALAAVGIATVEGKSYATKIKYGEDAVYTFEMLPGYEKLLATAVKKVDQTENIPVTVGKAISGDDDEIYTFTLAWNDIKDADGGVTLTLKGVTETYTASFDATDRDTNVVADGYTDLDEYEGGSEVTFVLSPKTGYQFSSDVINAINTAADKADKDTSSTFRSLTAYAIKSGQKLSRAAAKYIYPIKFTINPNGTLTGTITGSVEEAMAKGVTDNIVIHLPKAGAEGALTEDETFEVTFDLTDASVDDSAKLSDDPILEATYKKKYDFTVVVDTTTATSDGDVTLNALTYTIGDTTKSLTIGTPNVDGDNLKYEFSIPAEEVVGKIAIEATVLEVVTAKIKIAGGDAADHIKSVRYSFGSGSTPYDITEDQLAEISKKGTAANAADLKSGDALNLIIETDDELIINADDINDADGNDEVYLASSVTANGNTYTIKGTVLGTGTITLAGIGAGALTIDVSDAETAKTVTNSLQIQIGDNDWTSYAASKTAKLAENTVVKFRFKKPADENYNYKVVIGEQNKTDDMTLTNGYLVSEDQTIVASQTIEVEITTTLDLEGSKTFYVYNANSNITRLTVKADAADISTDTKALAYATDYLTNTRSTKLGVVKNPESVNGYEALAATSRTNVDTKNVTLTFTTAANYKPVITVDGDALATLIAKKDATITPAISSTVTTAAVNYTLTITKTAITNGDTIKIAAEQYNAAPIILEGASNANVVASINGTAIAQVADVSYNAAGAFKKNAGYTAVHIGDKVVLDVTPAAGYTITAASLLNLSTARETNISVKATGFSYTVTAGTVAQVLTVTATPSANFAALTGTPTPTGTSKTAVDSTTKATVTQWAYNTLLPGVEYEIPAATIGGATANISTVNVESGTIKDVYNATTNDTGTVFGTDGKFQISAKDAGTTFKLKVNGVSGAYTVKAAKALDSIKVTGATTKDGKNYLTQELGTTKDYAITVNSGASGAALDVAASGYAGASIEELTDTKGNPTGKYVLRVKADTAVASTPATANIVITDEVTSYSLFFTTTSKLTTATPGVTLKSATDLDLVLNLALPSTVSSDTYKNLDTAAVKLMYGVTVNKKGSTTAEPVFVDVTGASQTYTFDTANLQGVTRSATTRGTAQDFTVDVVLYLVAKNATNAEAALAKSLTKSATFATKAAKYATSVRLTAVNNKLYAGQSYTVAENPALTAAEITKSYYFDGTDLWYILANVTTDANATVLEDSLYTVTLAGNTTGINNSALTNKIVVLNGKLAIKVDDLNTALKTEANGAGTISVTVAAPTAAAATSQPVTATMNFTVEQRALAGMMTQDPTDTTLKLAKTSGKLLTTTLGINYNAATKAASNSLTFTAGTLSNIAASDITLTTSGSKATVKINKDFVFPTAGTVSFVVTATSKYNTDVTKSWTITLVAAEAQQAQGDIVVGIKDVSGETNDGKVFLLAQKGTSLSYGDYYDEIYVHSVVDVQGEITTPAKAQVYLLKPNAVVAVGGEIASDYIVDDTDLTVTSSNAKIATATGDVIALTGTAVGSVTLTATPQNTAVKKTVAFTVKAEELGKDEFFALKLVTNAENSELDPEVATETPIALPLLQSAKQASITFTSTGTDFWLDVMRATPNGMRTEMTPLLGYYAKAALKASTGITVDAATSTPETGTYHIYMYGYTGKVTVNGVTYTLYNEARKDVVSAGTISQNSTTPVYGDYKLPQSVTFTASGTMPNAAQVALSDDPDAKDAAITYVLAEGILGDATVDTAFDSKGKVTFTLPLDTSAATIAKGNYTFYAEYLDENGDPVSAPTKTTLKVTAAPTFTPKTSYTVALGNTNSFQFVSSKNTAALDANNNEVVVTNIYNVNTNGAYNTFTTLATGHTNDDNGFDNIVSLAASNVLLASTTANRTGYIEYTADGGVTTKTAKVTLSFTAGTEIAKDAVDTALTSTIKSNWSVENITAAKALTYVKSLVNLPSGVNLKWQSFNATYDGGKAYTKDALAAGEEVTIAAVLEVSKSGDTAKTLDLALTIPARTVTLTKTGVAGITYSLKDGANNTVTLPTTKNTYVTAGTIPVLNGATLTVTGISADTGYEPDTYYVSGNGVTKEQKSGSIVLNAVKDDIPMTLTAENTLTISKAANVTSVKVKYTPASTATETSEYVDVGTKLNVTSQTNVAFEVKTNKGYDAVLTETLAKVTPKNVTTKPASYDGTAVEFTAGDGTTASVNQARTYAFTAAAHSYTINVTLDDNSVYSAVLVKVGNDWVVNSDNEVTVEYGKTAQFRLQKAKTVSATTKGAYTTLVKQGDTVLKDSTPTNATYATFTTGKMDGENASLAITAASAENIGITLTNNDAAKGGNNAISGLKVTTIDVAKDWSVATNTKTAAYTSGKEIVIPGGTSYSFIYTVKDGYAATFTTGDPATTDTTGNKTYTFTVADANEEGAYTVVTKKSTLIGKTDLTTAVYDADATAAGIITDASYTYIDEDGDVASEDITLGAGATSNLPNRTAITIYATTADGYDLSVLVYRPGAANPTATKMTKVRETDGVQDWKYSTTIADGIAAIGFRPTAQKRTITISDPYPTTDVSSVYYYTQDKPTTKVAGRTGTASAAGVTTINTFYGSTVNVYFTTTRGLAEQELVAADANTTTDPVAGDDNITDYVATKALTYNYTIKVDAGFDKGNFAYKIAEVSGS